MASYEKVDALIDRLLAQTSAGVVRWKEGVQWNSFQAEFSDYSVVIQGPSMSGIGLGSGLESVTPTIFSLRVIDTRGEPVVSVPSGLGIDQLGTPDQIQRLKRLFEAARLSSAPSERAIDALLAELG